MQDKLIEESRCAHKRVVHRPMPIEGGLWTDRWYCDLCRCEFTPLAAVRAFTVQREQDIAEHQDALTWLENIVGKLDSMPQRILISNILKEKLAELRRGMKQPEKGGSDDAI